VQLISDSGGVLVRQSIPMIGLSQAAKAGLFDAAGYPVRRGWDEIPFPAVTDEHAYALEISGKSMEPAYRDDTLIVVSPAASIRRGDRVLVKTRNGEVKVKELRGRTGRSVELRSVDRERKEQALPVRDVLWMHRVVWASQ
jgi:phage repressor protein C with HTH and peptisase S24 domain